MAATKKATVTLCSMYTERQWLFDSFPLSLAALAFLLVSAGTDLSVPRRTWDYKGFHGGFGCSGSIATATALTPSPIRRAAAESDSGGSGRVDCAGVRRGVTQRC